MHQTLTLLYPLGSPALSSFYPYEQITPNSYTTSTPLQLNFYLILAPLKRLPPPPLPSLLNQFTPLAAQLLHHFTPSEQIISSLLHHFNPSQPITLKRLHHSTPLAAKLLAPFLPPHSLNKSPPTLTQLYPLAAQLLPHFIPLNKFSTHSYTFLSPHNKITPKPLTNLLPLAAELIAHFTTSEQITPTLTPL